MAVVLVINDDDSLLDMYESVLTELGHVPVAKATVASGPETVRDVGADALLVDLQRPDESEYGLRIIEELRSDSEMTNIPIVLCTAASDLVEPTLRRLDELEVPVLVKPFRIEQLERTLAEVLNADRTS